MAWSGGRGFDRRRGQAKGARVGGVVAGRGAWPWNRREGSGDAGVVYGDGVVIGGRGPVAGRGQWAGPKGPWSRPRERAGDTGARAPSGTRAGSWAPGEALGLRPGWGGPTRGGPDPTRGGPTRDSPQKNPVGIPSGCGAAGAGAQGSFSPQTGQGQSVAFTPPWPQAWLHPPRAFRASAGTGVSTGTRAPNWDGAGDPQFGGSDRRSP